MVIINDVTRTVSRLRSSAVGLRDRFRARPVAAIGDCTVPASRTDVDFTLQRVAGRAVGTVSDLIALGTPDAVAGEYLVILAVYDRSRDTSWSAAHHQLITVEALSRWQPGAQVPVLFDPFDQERILVG